MIRPATDLERTELLEGSEGFIAEAEGEVVGHIAWMPLYLEKGKPAEFYIHHFEVFDTSDSLIAARLWQAISKKSKELGYASVFGNWKATADITRLLANPRVEVDSYFVRIRHREDKKWAE